MSTEQRICVEELEKNLQIIACAGAGKTKTLVERIIYILSNGLAEPSNIVAITYTEKAAGEMKQRIYMEYEKANGNVLKLADMYVGTIHGYCLELLKICNPKYRNFEIINDIQTKLLIKKYFWTKEYAPILNDIVYHKSDKGTSHLDAKNWNDIGVLVSTMSFIREEQISKNLIPTGINAFLNSYISILEKHSKLDYSEIQCRFLSELKTSHILQDHIRKNLKFITIDEYQDVNTIQEKILQEIHSISPAVNICVVGDDDQTIYHWRGSNLSNFIEFPNRYSNVKKCNLTVNYRSSLGIVKTAEHIVVNNRDRLEKELNSNEKYAYDPGDILIKTDFPDIEDENDFILSAISKLKDSVLTDRDGKRERIGYDDMVILVHSPTKLMEFNPGLFEKLESSGIEFVIEGTKSLFKSPEIIDICNIFIFFNNNYNPKAFTRDYLGFAEGAKFKSIEQVLQHFKIDNNDKKLLDRLFETTAKEAFSDNAFWGNNTLQQLFHDTLQIFGIFNKLSFDAGNESIEKEVYNLASFSTLINDFETINFTDSLAYRLNNFIGFLIFDAQQLYPEGWLAPNFKSVRCLKIMSIHKAKGLEFPVVILPHMCKDYLFPVRAAGGKNILGLLPAPEVKTIFDRYKEPVESINRLLYVAATRSKKYLFLTKALEYSKPEGKSTYSKIPVPMTYASISTFANSNESFFLNSDLDYGDADETIEDDQLVFDFSTLKDFFECPHRFRLNSIFGFSSPLNVRMGYGSSIHNILEDVHRSYFHNGILKDSEKDIESLLDTYLYLPYADNLPELKKDTRASAKKAITEYLRQNKSTFSDIEFVEQKIDFKLNDMIFINGRVDLVKNNKSGEIKVIDFKSTNDVLSKDLKKKQLLIYALGYYKLTGVMPTTIVSYDVANTGPEAFSITPKDLELIEADVSNVYDSILKNHFPKCKKTNPSACKECAYASKCVG